MPRLLVLAYYFPPMGLSGVQRTAKFVKYLPEFGWEPWVVTVGGVAYWAFDPSMWREVRGSPVLRTPSLDPLWVLGRVGKRREVRARRGTQDLLVRLHQAFLVPDNKLGWAPFALRGGMKLLKKRGFGAIYATGPPFTAHLVGVLLKRRSGLPLLLDFRDPWSRSPFLSFPSPLHMAVHSLLERVALRAADLCTVTHKGIKGVLNLPSRRPPEVVVLPHGFDPDDFRRTVPGGAGKFAVVYTGAFYGRLTPKYLLEAVRGLLDEYPELREEIELVFVGAFREEDRELVRRWGLEDVVEATGYLPHRQSVERLCEAHLAWLMLGRGPFVHVWVPGKLFEYIGAGKPILACVPEGAAADLVRSVGGTVVPPDDVEAIRGALMAYYRKWRAGELSPLPEEAVRMYDRRLLTGRLAGLLDALTGR